MCHWDGRLTEEVEERIRDSALNWVILRKYWSTNGLTKTKLIVFQSVVFNAALSGLSVNVMPNVFTEKINSSIAKNAEC